ncbi:hypothetical protein UPYG_G00059500 [Umbra pygmaea]|uniref:Uncharacterized protein n=1 Tax=Umbra pygmaea TaxID=75934 RepID=A0ABD0XQY4_UMBPY
MIPATPTCHAITDLGSPSARFKPETMTIATVPVLRATVPVLRATMVAMASSRLSRPPRLPGVTTDIQKQEMDLDSDITSRVCEEALELENGEEEAKEGHT